MQKKVAFVEVSDGSTVGGIQAVLDPDAAKGLHTGCSVRLAGKLVDSKGGNQNVELKVESLEVLGGSDPEKYPLHKAKLPLEYLRELVHLRSRTKTFGSVLRVRNAAIIGIQNFFQSQSFLQVHTPLLTSHDCEGAGEVFRVMTGETLDSHIKHATTPPQPTSSTPSTPPTKEPTKDLPPTPLEFFNLPTYLTVSGQLHLEMLSSSISRVYTLNPTFRAEKSLSTRHLAEFWMLEAEVSFINNLDQLLALIEGCIVSTTKHVMESCGDELKQIAKVPEGRGVVDLEGL
ncbi:Asparaginyl-tRNA synthetase, partial [Blyttiomyces sp. JEL0837]